MKKAVDAYSDEIVRLFRSQESSGFGGPRLTRSERSDARRKVMSLG
jgi:hypothetical protein